MSIFSNNYSIYYSTSYFLNLALSGLLAITPTLPITLVQSELSVIQRSALSNLPGTTSDTDTKTLLQMARQAAGGEKLQQLTDTTSRSQVQLIVETGSLLTSSNETTVKYPDKFLTNLSGTFGKTTQAYDGKIAWRRHLGALQEFDGNILADFRNTLAKDTINLLNNFDKPGYQATMLQTEKIADRLAHKLRIVTPNGPEIVIGIDAETNLVIYKKFSSKALGTDVTNEEFYSDFQEVSGIKFPHKIMFKRNGEFYVESQILQIKVNTGVKDEFFQKPAK
jgi:hypothetical protein